MSAYSDWKCGALTDEEYKQAEQYEARKANYFTQSKIDEYFEGDCFDGEDDDEDCW